MAPTKSQRQRLQRQLEFYLSASNLRQDKFLQQHMDGDGFLPVELFLSFNRCVRTGRLALAVAWASRVCLPSVKALNATKRLVVEAADKSPLLRVDATQQRIAPVESPFDKEDDSDERTIYVEGYDAAAHDHDSLRKLFAAFGKVSARLQPGTGLASRLALVDQVALVSLPRFQSSRQFKGFAFVEFASADDATAALEALAASEPPAAELGGVKGWRKTQWLDLKRRLKAELAASSAVDGDRHAAADGEPKKQAAEKATAGHVRFRDEDADADAAEGPKQQEQEQEQQQESAKRRRTARENE
ncbi:hypothetical protein P43SY_009027 [Pythium insidiosum]|uniref:Uncharacterized protein n=1 Tax=Pythium insidiosum TaxID=114742 RepID=A0AAD5LJZ0_PYTIN|nr:hypothetical protein P43SY_009027 [Pythium insidiosum]